jgi:charged multivesicular body protein 5
VRAEGIESKIKKLDSEIMANKDRLSKLPEGSSAKSSLKQQTLRLLQQRKMYENQRLQMMNQSFNMEQTNFATQTMRDTVVQVDVMRTASKEMKKTIKVMNIDKVEDLRDDMEDLMMESNEIQEVLSRSYGLPDGVDEADLEAELDGLSGELFEAETQPSYLDSLPSTANTVSNSSSAEKNPMYSK